MGLKDTHCKVCGHDCGTKRSLHQHVKKEHGYFQGDYYIKYYPRKYLATGKPVQFKKSLDQYFSEEFASRKEFLAWMRGMNKDEVKSWAVKKLKARIDEKDLKYAPCQVELETLMMPSVIDYEKMFGSYDDLCADLGVEPLLKTKDLPQAKPFKEPTICIDTREQRPLKFPKSKTMALAFADYTLMGEDYNYTYVDRKDASDYRGTFGKQIDRFKRELETAIEMDSFIYVVIENTLEHLRTAKGFKGQMAGSEYQFRNMRALMHEYPRNIQFIFTGNRLSSQNLIPLILKFGDCFWEHDLYYMLRKNNLI